MQRDCRATIVTDFTTIQAINPFVSFVRVKKARSKWGCAAQAVSISLPKDQIKRPLQFFLLRSNFPLNSVI